MSAFTGFESAVIFTLKVTALVRAGSICYDLGHLSAPMMII